MKNTIRAFPTPGWHRQADGMYQEIRIYGETSTHYKSRDLYARDVTMIPKRDVVLKVPPGAVTLGLKYAMPARRAH